MEIQKSHFQCQRILVRKIFKELLALLKDGGCKLEEYNVTSYNLHNKLDKKFVVNSDEIDQLIVLYGKEKGNQINWLGRI